jgi:integrase
MYLHSGNIRKRTLKNGTNYQVNVELPPDPITGKRKRISETVPTKKQAEALLAKKLSELNSNTFIGENNIALKTYMSEWLTIYIKPHTSPTTYSSYEAQIRNHIYPTLGNLRIQSIKASDIQKLYNTLFTTKSSASGKILASKTIKNIHHNLRSCLSRAVKDEIIRRNAADDVILPRERKKEITIFSKQETAQLLAAVADTSMELIINMAIATGARRGEMCAMEWSDVDFDKRTITINKNAVFVKGQRIIKSPKSAAGVRTITVPEYLLDMLLKWHAIYLINRTKGGTRFQDNNLVIYKPEDGTPFHPDSISQKFERLLKRLGMRHQKFHSLRHISATILIGMGISPKVVSKRLGHANIQITLDVYSHVLQEMENDAAEKINDALVGLSTFGEVKTDENR